MFAINKITSRKTILLLSPHLTTVTHPGLLIFYLDRNALKTRQIIAVGTRNTLQGTRFNLNSSNLNAGTISKFFNHNTLNPRKFALHQVNVTGHVTHIARS